MEIKSIVQISVLASATFPLITFAAAFDRTGQPITDFLQDGDYASLSYSYTKTSISGKDTGLNNGGHPNNVPNIANNIDGFRASYKTRVNNKWNIGLLYDQPFGSDTEHTGDSDFVSKYQDGHSEGTKAYLHSQSITGLLGYNLNPNFQLYGGASYQELKGSIKLRGQIYKNVADYNGETHTNGAWGWVTGISYKKPELGLKTSLTYRSEIEHNANTIETFNAISTNSFINKSLFTTPQSVNFDFQMGLNKTTLLLANLRWVDWSAFEYKPVALANKTKSIKNPEGLALLNLHKDQLSAQLGVAKRILPKVVLSSSVNWDSGLGEPANALGPVAGAWGVGFGIQYDLTKQWALSLGGRYTWLGDAQAARQNGDIVGDFSGNDAMTVGLKLSYQAK
ncbi:outer membrane beta-barrel protein [Acinetobacter nosocomialis]|uniref:OmpP1/FadL family transporter n=1 Tax=Acinetobacter nosocomialis TaxID=106654 RepID=UPI0002D08C53|nr:outer membrane beta-barrel protein [Acinetobacter nosocomialis]ENU47267.1 hypothetical protein F984_01636 [Acinetobacter nosocomialis NIPH 2119]QXC10664.1 outer membrane beta-barrel protein [Acinetobacter nosocomialis]